VARSAITSLSNYPPAVW